MLESIIRSSSKNLPVKLDISTFGVLARIKVIEKINTKWIHIFNKIITFYFAYTTSIKTIKKKHFLRNNTNLYPIISMYSICTNKYNIFTYLNESTWSDYI